MHTTFFMIIVFIRVQSSLGSSLRVIESGRDSNRRAEEAPELVMKPDPRRGYWAAPGDTVRLSCSSTGSQRTHKLSMFVMGWNAGTLH